MDAYTAFVDELSREKEGDVYWWTTSFASRDFAVSHARQKIALFLLAMECVKADPQLKEILVNDAGLQDALQKALGQTKIAVHLTGKEEKKRSCFAAAKSIRSFIRYRLRCKKALSSVGGHHTTKTIQEEPHRLLQTYVEPGDYRDGRFASRYFPGLSEYIDQKVTILPYFGKTEWSDLQALCRHCCEDLEFDYLFRELHLRVADYLKLYGIFRHYRSYLREKKVFRGFDVTEIVNEDLRSSAESFTTYYGIVDFHLFRRLKQASYPIRSFLSWYEAQPCSMGAFLGIRRFYAAVKNTGYISIPIDPTDCRFAPSKEQVRQKVTPERLSVIGSYYQKGLTRYARAETLIGPALRIQGIYEEQEGSHPEHDRKQILLVLPYFTDQAARLLAAVNEMTNAEGMAFVIRNHPDHKGMELSDYGCRDFRFAYSFSAGSFLQAATQADVVVIMNASAGFESVLLGRPVLCFAEPGEINFTHMPKEWAGTLYQTAYDAEELREGLQLLLEQTAAHPDIAAREQYLARAEKETVEALF